MTHKQYSLIAKWVTNEKFWNQLLEEELQVIVNNAHLYSKPNDDEKRILNRVRSKWIIYINQ